VVLADEDLAVVAGVAVDDPGRLGDLDLAVDLDAGRRQLRERRDASLTRSGSASVPPPGWSSFGSAMSS
jgi:hypothetical protein